MGGRPAPRRAISSSGQVRWIDVFGFENRIFWTLPLDQVFEDKEKVLGYTEPGNTWKLPSNAGEEPKTADEDYASDLHAEKGHTGKEEEPSDAPLASGMV